MDALIVVPTYDERDNLPVLVRALVAQPSVRVMVVDDQSPDGTGEVAEALARELPGRVEVVHRSGRRGLGRAYVEGLTRALAQNPDVICQMDADLSHDPQYVPALLAALADYDLAIGSRYITGVSVVNWPLHRLVLSACANSYARIVTGLTVRDCTSGFRCWRRETLVRVPLHRMKSDGYAFLIETLYEAVRRGCRVGEVPIIFVERRQGRSKLSGPVLAESLLMPWRVRLRIR